MTDDPATGPAASAPGPRPGVEAPDAAAPRAAPDPADPGDAAGSGDAAGPGDAADPATLAAVLRPSLLRLTRTIRNRRLDDSVTLTLIAALVTLERSGPMSPSELAATERVQPPSMTKVLAKLVGKGLVHRAPHATDRRQVVVSITDKGRALLADERHETDAWLSTRLAMITPDERAALVEIAPLLDRLATL